MNLDTFLPTAYYGITTFYMLNTTALFELFCYIRLDDILLFYPLNPFLYSHLMPRTLVLAVPSCLFDSSSLDYRIARF